MLAGVAHMTEIDEIKQTLAWTIEELKSIKEFYQRHIDLSSVKENEIPKLSRAEARKKEKIYQFTLRLHGGSRYKNCEVYIEDDGRTVTIENVKGGPIRRWYPVIDRVIAKIKRGETI